MSRYANEFPVTKSPEEVSELVTSFLKSEGFTYKDYSDEQKVWQKGGGWVGAPQFIRVMVKPGSVKIEAWIKYALLPGVYVGEMGITGFFGIAIKVMLRDRVVALERALQQ